MDGQNKKREIKTRDKASAKDKGTKKKSGTVNFTFDPNRKKHGDKKGGPKKSGEKRPFTGDKKRVYSNRDGKTGGTKEQSHSQHRREKQKVSDLIKKLRINYNKLLMKKKELK